MPNMGNTRRRWFGVIYLGVALAMLIGGQTVLKPHLQGLRFITYWLICLAFTGLAILIALLDLHTIRAQAREEQRDLVRETLEQIERDGARTERRNPQSEIHQNSPDQGPSG